MKKRRKDGWTKGNRAVFLDHLAASCNVRRSCAAAGVSTQALYKLRRRDPEFRIQWQEALEAGYQMLETLVLERAQGLHKQDMPVGETPTPDPSEIDIQLAVHLLNSHRKAVKGGGAAVRTGGFAPGYASREETDAAILKQLKILGDRLKAQGRG